MSSDYSSTDDLLIFRTNLACFIIDLHHNINLRASQATQAILGSKIDGGCTFPTTIQCKTLHSAYKVQ